MSDEPKQKKAVSKKAKSSKSLFDEADEQLSLAEGITSVDTVDSYLVHPDIPPFDAEKHEKEVLEIIKRGGKPHWEWTQQELNSILSTVRHGPPIVFKKESSDGLTKEERKALYDSVGAAMEADNAKKRAILAAQKKALEDAGD